MGPNSVTAPVTIAPLGVVGACDIAEGVTPVASPHGGARAVILVRLFTEPIGVAEAVLPHGGLSAEELASLISAEFGAELKQRLEDCGWEWTEQIPTDGLEPARTPRYLESRQRVMASGPSITAAICTRDRPDVLREAIESLGAQEYERLHVIVVDNAPPDNNTREVVASFGGDVEYALERRPGLSWARNRALELSSSEVLAYVDDDARCDRWWAAEVARGFVEVPEADAVTGTVFPAELDTPSQMFFDQYSSVRRQRGFTRAVFSPATWRQQSPLYPLPPFGIGANMAFRRSTLQAIGGFDPALGPGTATHAADDTGALSGVLLAGGTIVYQPSALVHHRNRRDESALRGLLRGHGRGVGAFYTSMVVRRPGCMPELLRLAPRALRDQFSPSGQRLRKLDSNFPHDLLSANRRGLLEGPFAYAAARFEAARLAKVPPE